MKKLMIAAAIVCAAAMSQASQATWGTGKMYYGGVDTQLKDTTKTEVAKSVTGYLFVLGDDATAAANYAKMTSASDIWAAFTENGTSSTLTIGEKTYTVTSTGTSGNKSSAINFLDGNTYGNDGTLYGIVVVTHNGADGVDAYSANGFTAAESTAGTSNGSLALQWGADGGTGAATTWQSVPEPTSGLLLLLGVAGLALRRRRA